MADKARKKKSKASGPRSWTFDGAGNIVNFSLKGLRADVLLRLRTDNLYTLEECKVLVKEVLKYATAWLEVELAQLMYMSDLHQKLLPSKASTLGYQWPRWDLPALPFDFAGDAAAGNPRFRVGKFVEEVNKSLIRVVDTLLVQRKERHLFAARILEDLEGIEALR
eukprot:TRINITY_DN8636_c0_g2_i1.p1 TRINITY_DN8636_c0_g2~~TRINITY_DN8636_c0_g2_i1.p1  ORF type:complete len:166 (+),score=75.04 TRINITY_DN8636_c0_g2_i1:60-557(+)